MKSQGKYFASICTLLLLSLSGTCQQIKNVQASFDGEKAIISYDLVSDQADDKFKVIVFSSHDNFQTPLSLLVGDAGENVLPGGSHRITWDAKSSLPADFNNTITFKIKAKVAVGLHHTTRLEVKPLDFASFKRGGILNIEWNGGKEGEPITVELLRKNELLEKLDETKNNNLYSWSISSKTKPGKDYSIRISRSTNTDIKAISQPFEIKPKLSLWVKLIPVLVAGGVVAILSGPKEKQEDPDLPGPIKPGG